MTDEENLSSVHLVSLRSENEGGRGKMRGSAVFIRAKFSGPEAALLLGCWTLME